MEKGNPYRREYLQGITALITRRRLEANIERKEYIKDIVANPSKYRKDFVEMLGWPLTEKPTGVVPNSKKVFVAKEANATVYRLQIEIVKDLFYYGLLFVKDEEKKRPLVISQHGGAGSPELCSSLFASGSANYNDMTQRILQYDVNVFAPQMLLWDKEACDIPYDRLQIDTQLKQLGGSITALEIYCLKRSIDSLTALHYVDEEKIGMIGLSYGGSYTLLASAADERIKSCISCSFFNDRYQYDWPDWVWFHSAHQFLDSEIAMLIYPRRLCIQIGKADELFAAQTAQAEYEKLKEFADSAPEKDWLQFMIFEGTHEFCKDDAPIARLVGDLYGL